MAVWILWLHRNRIVFGNTGLQRSLLDETLARAAEVAYLVSNGNQNTIRNKIQVKWLNPPSNWFKLNSDGSARGNPGLACSGGLIRNEKGEWVKGYARAIGITSSVAAEFWALRDGIRLCIALKLPAVEIELDAKVVIDLVRNESNNLNSLDALVADYKEGLKKILNVSIWHCFREANKCADNLAKRGALLDQDFVVFTHPPSEVELLIRLDAMGTMYDRFVTSSSEVF
ncbi:hypothetical protein SO802_016601 [Lithocarpus litseifolius]|uniref:RNase H type-1 domain-containing protein n=1 Tax=Lithocarpus litseifolius TaxID=425828 RepID=A0AAW2CWZ7_9ROSI